MGDVDRAEFEDLKRQVRSLERQVDAQQEQIAALKRRTTTDTGVNGTSSSGSGGVEVPQSSIKLDIIDILRDGREKGDWVKTEEIKNEAAQMNHLRSEAKAVIRNWLNEGYLVGDLDGTVKITEWPPETQSIS